MYFDYRSEGSGALDFRGENIWTTGNWGFVDGRGDATRVALPSNWYSLLGAVQTAPVTAPTPSPVSPPTTVPTPSPVIQPTPTPVVTPAPLTPISGVCGSSHGVNLQQKPTAGLCATGNASAVMSAGGRFTWMCSGQNGGSVASCSATNSPVPLPVATITSSVSQVNYNGTAVISWTSQNALSCTITGGRSGTTGTFTTEPLTQATTFAATCTGPSGQAQSQVTVAVNPQPVAQPPVVQSPAVRVSAVSSTDPSSGSFEATRSTPSFSAASGNLIIVSVVFDKGEGATGVTISDTAGNVYQSGSPVQAGGTTKYVQQFYVLSSQANASNVVTATYSGKAGDPLEVSAVQYSAPGKSWVLDGAMVSTSGSGFAPGPVVSPSLSTTGAGVISTVATGYYGIVQPISTGQDTLVHQIENTGWVLERITSGSVSGTVVSTQAASQGGYGKFALSTAAFKAQ
jgi:hypothetical protein